MRAYGKAFRNTGTVVYFLTRLGYGPATLARFLPLLAPSDPCLVSHARLSDRRKCATLASAIVTNGAELGTAAPNEMAAVAQHSTVET